jgi:hypothetical protein
MSKLAAVKAELTEVKEDQARKQEEFMEEVSTYEVSEEERESLKELEDTEHISFESDLFSDSDTKTVLTALSNKAKQAEFFSKDVSNIIEQTTATQYRLLFGTTNMTDAMIFKALERTCERVKGFYRITNFTNSKMIMGMLDDYNTLLSKFDVVIKKDLGILLDNLDEASLAANPELDEEVKTLTRCSDILYNQKAKKDIAEKMLNMIIAIDNQSSIESKIEAERIKLDIAFKVSEHLATALETMDERAIATVTVSELIAKFAEIYPTSEPKDVIKNHTAFLRLNKSISSLKRIQEFYLRDNDKIDDEGLLAGIKQEVEALDNKIEDHTYILNLEFMKDFHAYTEGFVGINDSKIEKRVSNELKKLFEKLAKLPFSIPIPGYDPKLHFTNVHVLNAYRSYCETTIDNYIENTAKLEEVVKDYEYFKITAENRESAIHGLFFGTLIAASRYIKKRLDSTDFKKNPRVPFKFVMMFELFSSLHSDVYMTSELLKNISITQQI